MPKEYLVRNPLFPTYPAVRAYLQAFIGEPLVTVRKMIDAIHGQTGTPQNPVDWSDPDSWIVERLRGDEKRLALKLWESSGRSVNPRHIYGTYLLVNTYRLMIDPGGDGMQLTEDGQGFLADNPDVVHRIDREEGIGKLLSILATHTDGKRSDLLPEWSQYLLDVSKFASASTFQGTLRLRLQNLIERGMVEKKDSIYYRITKKGLEYAETFPKEAEDVSVEVRNAIHRQNDACRLNLRERLATMNPYRFEELIRDLLEAMGYDDVTVTKQSGDMGVDVVANVQFGITTIKEVVQVKRHKGSIGRPILDQLRGSLPYHNAIRGTIITLGTVSSGCKEAALFPNAAPIGLIDGEKLLDLLMEHEIGIRKKPAILFELDESRFEEDAGEIDVE